MDNGGNAFHTSNMRSNNRGSAGSVDGHLNMAPCGVRAAPGSSPMGQVFVRGSARAVLDVGEDSANSAALIDASFSGGPPVVVARSNGDIGQVWRFPAVGGGCWHCVLASGTWSAPDINVADLVRAWAAVVVAALLAGTEVDDRYQLRLDPGDTGLLQPQWSSGPFLRHPRCSGPRCRPAPFEQLALLL